MVCRREPAQGEGKGEAGGPGRGARRGRRPDPALASGGSSLHQPAGSRLAAGPLPPHPTPAVRPPRGPGSSWCGAAASGAPARDRSGRRRLGHLRCTLTSATRELASTPSRSPFVRSPPIRPLPHLFSHPLPRETLPPLSLSPCPRSCASSQHAAHPSGDQHRCFPGAICTPVLPSLSFSSISPPAWPRARRRHPAPIPSGLRAGLPPGHVRMEIRQHEWLSASPHEGFEQMRLKSRPKEPSPSLTRVGANFYSSVKQQDYSASVWLRRKDKLEHVRTTRSWGARWSEHRALGV